MKRIILICGAAILGLNAMAQQATPQDPTTPWSLQESAPDNPEWQAWQWIEKNPSQPLGIEVHSINSGNWSDPANWDCGCVPNIAHDVNVMAGDSIAVDEDVQIGHLSIEETAILAAMPESEISMYVAGDWTNLGDFQCNSSTVQFFGEVEQQISGENEFYRISIDPGASAVVLGPLNVRNALYLSGSLVSNDMVTLKSNGINSSAYLAPVMGGTLEGDITLERTIQSTANGWLTVGAPFQDATVAQWADDVITTGFEGSDYPTYSLNNIQYYNETAVGEEDPFSGVTSVDDLLIPGQGYYVYTNAGTRTFDVQGTPVIGSFDLPVSFTDSGDPNVDGLSVLANPYPCNISWEETGWDMNNMYNTIYVWDVSINQFRTYTSGYGVNGGTPLIRSGETFWVQSYGPDPMLTINEYAKVGSNWENPVNTGDQFLKINLTGLGLGDEMIIAFNDDATHNFDPTMDARKFFSGGSEVNISTVSQDDWDLAINQVPIDMNSFEVPIRVSSQEAGTLTLELEHVPNVPERCMYIEDLITGTLYPLEEGSEISFETEAVEEEIRFLLRLDEMMAVEAQAPACFGIEDGAITAMGVGDGPWTYTWSDSEGAIIQEEANSMDASTVADLAPGTYYLSVDIGGQCATLQSQIVFEAPVEIVLDAAVTQLECDETNTAAIEVIAEGGTGEFTALWDDDSTGMVRTGLEAGTYVVLITDEAGCSEQQTIVVDMAPTVEAAFTPDAQIVNLENGTATVNFQNNSVNATDFLWNFGDGGMASMDENPSHTFTETGAFIVSLYASNDECDASYQQVIIVEDAVSINEIPVDEAITVSMENEQPHIQFRHEDLKDYSIECYNLLGQQLMSPIQGAYGNQKIRLDLLHQVPVMIINVRNTQNDQQQTFKIMR